eukprot:898505-Karenia_brevis.AAC.1
METTPPRRFRQHSRSRSAERQLCTRAQSASFIWGATDRILVLANEAKTAYAPHDTFIDFRSTSCIPKLAKPIQQIFGSAFVNDRMVILNCRSYSDKM